jgi:hypothetical protein
MPTQIEQSGIDTREAAGPEAFVSSDDKYMFAIEPSDSLLSNEAVALLNTYEWGEYRDEVSVTRKDLVRLHTWLGDFLGLDS